MFRDLKNYVNNRITLTKYEILESISTMLASAVYTIVLGFFVMFLVLIGSIALGFFLGRYFNSYGYGFLAVTAMYFVFLIICIIFKKRLKLILANIAIENAINAFSNQDEDEE